MPTDDIFQETTPLIDNEDDGSVDNPDPDNEDPILANSDSEYGKTPPEPAPDDEVVGG